MADEVMTQVTMHIPGQNINSIIGLMGSARVFFTLKLCSEKALENNKKRKLSSFKPVSKNKNPVHKPYMCMYTHTHMANEQEKRMEMNNYNKEM